MSTVILVRPGCTDFDERKRIQGALDLPLNQRGQTQLTRLLDALRSLPLEQILTGPSEPARSTAAQLAETLDVPLRESRELRNMDFGLWQGLSLDDMRRRFPGALRLLEESPGSVHPPEGEAVQAVLERLQAALKKPLRKYDTFVIVASEPLAALLRAVLRDAPLEDLSRPLFERDEQSPVEVLDLREPAAATR